MHSPYVLHTPHANGRTDPSGAEDSLSERTCAMFLGQPHGALVTTASIINALEEQTRGKVLAELPDEIRRGLLAEQQQRAMLAATRMSLPANAAAAQEMMAASGFLALSTTDALAAASHYNYNLMKAAGIRNSGGIAAGHHHHPGTCTPMDYNLGTRLSGVPLNNNNNNNNMSSINPTPRNGFINPSAAVAVMGNYNNPANGFSTANYNQNMYPRTYLGGRPGGGGMDVGYTSQDGVPGGGMTVGYNPQGGVPGEGGIGVGYNPQGGVLGGGAVGMSVGYNSHGGPVAAAAASSSHGFRPKMGGSGGMVHSPTLIGSGRQMSPAGASPTNMNLNMNTNLQQMEMAGLVLANSIQFPAAATQRFSALPPGAFPGGNSGQMLRQHRPMISTYLDDFKQGFPSKGLSVVSNHWWGGAEPAEKPAETTPGNEAEDLSQEKDRENYDAGGASLCKDTDGCGHPTLSPLIVTRRKEDKKKDMNEVLNSCRKVTRSRKLAAASSRRALQSGIAKGYGQQKLGRKEAAILQFVFGDALPKQWSAAFPDNG